MVVNNRFSVYNGFNVMDNFFVGDSSNNWFNVVVNNGFSVYNWFVVDNS